MERDADLEALLEIVEEKLRARAQAALRDGRYGKARRIVELLDRLLEASGVITEVQLQGNTENKEADGLSESAPSGRSSDSDAPSVVVGEDRSQEPENNYPTYGRENNHLVKVGWSSKNEEEYRHRAPRGSVQAVCDRIGEVASEKRRFDRDDLDEISVNGESVPDYQVYLCLGWLRWSGLVNRHGRGGYSVPQLNEFDDLVGTAWKQLPESAA